MDELDIRKTKEYSQYNLAEVHTDVTHDIKHNQIKLFYMDLEEVPQLLVIDENQNNLPPHSYVPIGTGCTDSYNSEDCSTTYRQVIDKTLAYGKKYNHAIAKHFNLKLKQILKKNLNPTQKFISDNSSDLDSIKVELSDVQALFGGRHIWIDSSGHVFIQSIRPTQKGLEQKNFAFVLEANEIKKITETFIEQDFISLKDSKKTAPPDQANPKIILTNSLGQQHSVTNWDPPLPNGDKTIDSRFHAVYRAIKRLEAKAIETCEPINLDAYKDSI